MPNNEDTDILEAKKRLESLPENLKKGILADKNVQLIYNICRDYSIPEDKVKHIALLVGEVFLGYIKPEEVAHELNTYFDIDLQKSNFIEIELKQKLFNGLKADLDKIYNPIKIEVPAEEIEEAGPTIIKLEADQPVQSLRGATEAPLSGATSQTPRNDGKISPLTIGSIPTQPTPRQSGLDTGQAKPEIPTTAKTISEQIPKEEAPFIIQTKVEAVKPAIPQFPKEAPSLNLRVDPSIIQKTQITKPISIRLETAQPAIEKKFQMPVIAEQKVFSGTPVEKVSEKPSAVQSLRGATEAPLSGAASQTPRNDEKVLPTILQATQQQPLSSPSLKQISEQKTTPTAIGQKSFGQAQDKSFGQTPSSAPLSGTTASEQSKPAAPELSRTVHYSNFKTDLTNLGAPVKPKSKKDGFINLTTFTKVSGNTVDLRKSN